MSRRAIGESSNPQPTEPKPRRQLTTREKELILQFITLDDLEFALDNPDLELTNLSESINCPEHEMYEVLQKFNNDMKTSNGLINNILSVANGILLTDHRFCIACKQLGEKSGMAKCRKCSYWFHDMCTEGVKRNGKSDPVFRFFFCPSHWTEKGKIKRTRNSISRDAHFEDSDNDTPT